MLLSVKATVQSGRVCTGCGRTLELRKNSNVHKREKIDLKH